MQLYDAFFQSAIFRNILYYLILCLEGIVGFKIEDDFVYLSTEGFSCHNINEKLRLLKNIKIHKMYKKKLILELSQSIFNNKNTLGFFLLLTKYNFNSFTVKVLLVYIVYISIKVYIFSSKNHQNSSANQLLSVLYILYCVRNYRLTCTIFE